MAKMNARAALFSDIDRVHAELMSLIDSMEYYNDEFRRFEKSRFNKTFLRTLLLIDPWHIMILESDDEIGGFLISGPANGTLFQFWSCVFPAFRNTPLGIFGMRSSEQHWNNSRFHKASTYCRSTNDLAIRLLKRYKYEQVAYLENHIFGQDYVIMERQYTKTTEGYDAGITLSFSNQLKLKLRALFDR